MSDLIDRQAAIEVIDSFNVFESRSDQIKLEQMIGELPPAQPEQLSTNLAEVGTEERAEERTETHACDCINRQQAIDEIDEWIKAFRENGHKESAADACLIQDGIIQLPPAQTEQHHDEWCTDCKEYDKERHCCPRWNKVIRQALADAQPEPHIDADGTMWVTVPDIKQVKRVIVDEEKSKFCRQFYLEEEQRTGKWIKKHRHYGGFRSYTGFDSMGEQHTITVDERAEYDDLYCSECGARSADNFLNFCPNCGAKMMPSNAK